MAINLRGNHTQTASLFFSLPFQPRFFHAADATVCGHCRSPWDMGLRSVIFFYSLGSFFCSYFYILPFYGREGEGGFRGGREGERLTEY